MTRIVRLTPADLVSARELFLSMAAVFENEAVPLSDDYLRRLLARESFWAIAAFVDDQIAGGLTAHALPMTTSERSALFIYDVAVAPALQRQGIGRRLIGFLREQAARQGIDEVFVPAENEDSHALEFYRSLGGRPTEATFFDFGPVEA